MFGVYYSIYIYIHLLNTLTYSTVCIQYLSTTLSNYYTSLFLLPTQHHYPDILHYAKIAPASWFFSMCYRITSRVMDSRYRAKFQMVKDSDIRDALHSVFDAEKLPLHLYGEEKGLDGSTSSDYSSVVDVLFDVSSVHFPSREGKPSLPKA